MGLSQVKVFNTLNTTIANKSEMQPGTLAYQASKILLDCRAAKRASEISSLWASMRNYTVKAVWNMELSCISDEEGENSVHIIIMHGKGRNSARTISLGIEDQHVF